MKFENASVLFIYALAGVLFKVSALPTLDVIRTTKDLTRRIDIPVPLPKVIPVAPKPIPVVPKPVIVPKPVEPAAPVPKPAAPVPKPVKPAAPVPKPVEPAAPVPKPATAGTICKRANGCVLQDPKLEKIRTDGVSAQNDLDQAIANRAADAPNKDLGKDYHIAVLDEQNPFPPQGNIERTPYLDKVGLDATPARWTRTDITNPDTDPDEGAILTTYDSKEQNTMVISQSWNKENDIFREDPEDAGKVIKWSDMVMDIWRKVSGAGIRDLKYMVRDKITTDDTRSAIDTALEANHPGSSQVHGAIVAQTFNRISQNGEQTGYQLLSGTVHGNRVLRMLKDNHGELGDLKINAYHVLKQPALQPGPSGLQEPTIWYHMIIEFGH